MHGPAARAPCGAAWQRLPLRALLNGAPLDLHVRALLNGAPLDLHVRPLLNGAPLDLHVRALLNGAPLDLHVRALLNGAPLDLHVRALLNGAPLDLHTQVGLVFQFPERHFLGSDIFSELTFSWPRDPAFFVQQQALRARVEKVGVHGRPRPGAQAQPERRTRTGHEWSLQVLARREKRDLGMGRVALVRQLDGGQQISHRWSLRQVLAKREGACTMRVVGH